MSLIIPIVLVALIAGTAAPRMTPRLWSVVALVVVVSIAWFYTRH